MISHRISRLAGRPIPGIRSDRTFAALPSLSKNSEHPRESHSQTPEIHHGFPAMPENSQTRLLDSVVPISVGNFGLKLQFSQAKPFPGAMSFRRFLHSAAPSEFEKETDTRPIEMQMEPRPYETDRNARPTDMHRNIRNIEMERNPRSFGPPERRWNRPTEGNTGPFEMRRNTGFLDTDMNTRPNEMFRSFRPSGMEQNSGPFEMERNPRSFGPPERRWNRPTEGNTGPLEMRRNTGFLDTDMNSRPNEMFRSFRPSGMEQNSGPFEMGLGTRTTERNTRLFDFNGRPTESNIRPLEFDRDTRSMDFARGILEDNGKDYFGGNRFSRYTIERNSDIVHIKLMRNNAYVTVTDSKGNKKVGASGGLLSAMKGGPKVSRYSAEATAEHVGRLAKDMGLKSVVVKVNGFTYFKKKKQAVLSFRDGYTHSRSDQNPIVYIEDTTRRAHNGCRLRKKRRV